MKKLSPGMWVLIAAGLLLLIAALGGGREYTPNSTLQTPETVNKSEWQLWIEGAIDKVPSESLDFQNLDTGALPFGFIVYMAISALFFWGFMWPLFVRLTNIVNFDLKGRVISSETLEGNTELRATLRRVPDPEARFRLGRQGVDTAKNEARAAITQYILGAASAYPAKDLPKMLPGILAALPENVEWSPRDTGFELLRVRLSGEKAIDWDKEDEDLLKQEAAGLAAARFLKAFTGKDSLDPLHLFAYLFSQGIRVNVNKSEDK